MTATQVFLQFLRETCTLQEYLFFRHIISHDNGNKYFRKRPLFKPDFVEGYLSRNNRPLAGFMSRIFVLAPNLTKKANLNPRWAYLIKTWGMYSKGRYVLYYRQRWRYWLEKRVEVTDKKLCSPFKKGESYDFKLNNEKVNYPSLKEGACHKAVRLLTIG